MPSGNLNASGVNRPGSGEGGLAGLCAGVTPRPGCRPHPQEQSYSEPVRARSGWACWSTQSPVLGRVHHFAAAGEDPERPWALIIGRKGLHRAETMSSSGKGMRGFEVHTQSTKSAPLPVGPHPSKAPTVTSNHKQQQNAPLLRAFVYACTHSLSYLANTYEAPGAYWG